MPVKKIIQREMPKVGLHETVIPYEEVVKWFNDKFVIIYGNIKGNRITFKNTGRIHSGSCKEWSKKYSCIC